MREGSDAAILSLGALLGEANKAAELLEQEGITCTVADARFAKPLDGALLSELVRHHERVAVLEEGSIGGFAAQVHARLAGEGGAGAERIVPLSLPDTFIAHAGREEQLEEAGLTAARIAERIRKSLKS